MIALEDVPELRDPILIAAFEGWNDAGEAATAVIAHLVDVWNAEPIAALDQFLRLGLAKNMILIFVSRRQTIENERFERVGGKSLARLVKLAQVVLAARLTLFGAETEPMGGFLKVALHAVAKVVIEAQIVLRDSIAL